MCIFCINKVRLLVLGGEAYFICLQNIEFYKYKTNFIFTHQVVKGAGGSWPKEVSLFLFDHQLVYCKRDLLKRSSFVYRGRINLDHATVEDLRDTQRWVLKIINT